MKKIFFISPGLFFILLLFFSCRQKNNIQQKKSPYEIVKADEAFSDLSKKEGMKMAFIEYIDNNGVLLRPDHMPIIGANAIDFLSQSNDSLYQLTWKPSGGDIATSGDLGYTFGIYTLTMKDTVMKGTYVSIWKKQKNGKWKFVLDSGNDGLGNDTIGNKQ